MNIDELLATLQKLNINITNKEIADAWGMEASSFSRKKRNKSQISYENIKKIEDKLNIKLTFAEVLNISFAFVGISSFSAKPVKIS